MEWLESSIFPVEKGLNADSWKWALELLYPNDCDGYYICMRHVLQSRYSG